MQQTEQGAKVQTRRLYLNRKKPIATYCILGVTIAVFLLEWHFGALDDAWVLVQMGAKFNPAIAAGQYWRLITPIFLHVDLMHIFCNMLALYWWGPTIELLFGRAKFVAIYLLSGIVGNALSYFFSASLAVGASGAIFGIFGTLLSFRKSYPDVYKQVFGTRVLIILALNIVNGLLTPQIDNFGHLGGIIGGFLVSEMLGTLGFGRINSRKIAAGAALAALIGVCLYIGPLHMI
nr:rhomboid family intramembrane serine protease [Maliibacterium massiliense]